VKRLLPVLATLACLVATPRLAFASHCTEVSDVVGYERCHRFGDGWAVERRPALAAALALPLLSFDPNRFQFDAARGKGDPTLSFPGSALGVRTLDTAGFGLRIEGFFFGPLYTGVSFGMGFGHAGFASVTADGQVLSPSNAFVNTTIMYGGALLGVRVPLGWVSFRLEGLFGGSSLDISQHSAIGDFSSTAGHGLIEPHLIFDVWATPNVTLSAYAGANVFDTKERSMGLVLEFHGRSFDGQYAFW
jgi:hypothetical protein